MAIIEKCRLVRLSVFLMAMSMGLFSCGGLGTSLSMKTDSDEEAEAFDKYMDAEIIKDKARIKRLETEISVAEIEKNNLGGKNKHLTEVKEDKSSAVNKIFRELREDVAKDRELERKGRPRCTRVIECENCGKRVEFTFDKLQELVKRYRNSYTLRDKYVWYLLHEWDCHVNQGKNIILPACYDCMDEGSITKLEKTIAKNIGELAKLEAKLVLDRLNLADVNHQLSKDERSKYTVSNQSERRQFHREEAKKARAETEKAEEALEIEREERKKEVKQTKFNMAKSLLEAGVPRNVILTTITGLTEEELNSISSPGRVSDPEPGYEILPPIDFLCKECGDAGGG